MALGGNAPVMARRFALEGADVLLAAKMSKSFNEDSHESIKVTGEDIIDDDIHLILVRKIHEKKYIYLLARPRKFPKNMSVRHILWEKV